MSPAQASCGDSLIITSSGFALNSTTTNASPSSNWSPSQSASLYKIDGWGVPYFSVNSSGNISVRPHGVKTLPHQEIDLMEVVKKVLEQKTSGGLGLQLPIIVRFPDVLKNRLECLQSAFDIAIESQDYRSHYQGVYPVKCNQDRFIVEDIVEFGSKFRFGLEAGSKPELLLAMSSLCKGSSDAFLICNGYKDAEYISLALVARRLELNTVIVLEQEEELDLVIDISRELGVRPVIGLRAKLRTKHSGHFGATSGEKGKFGLTTMQILRVAKKLEQAEMLDCLQLLHFHIGSQIPSTSLLSDGVGEAANIYCELVRLGVGMQFIDVGGGLGIDYDGSGLINSEVSISYGLEEYAETVVHAIRSACDRKSVKHPVICSESGRALVSHHSILIFEAVGATVSETPALSPISTDYQYFVEGLSEDAQEDYRNMISSAMSGEYEMFILYSDKLKHRCVEQFKEGAKDLEYLAAMDHICESVVKALGRTDSVRTYHVNLSIFTSMPDFWAIDQQFPIIPIHRLDQRPGVKGILSDLTCDSDGKVDKFICGESSLLLHELGEEDENGVAGGYYLGMFLGGAYQEALGGFHNLFGGPSVVRVLQNDGPNTFAVTQTSPGMTCMEVLRVMQHEPELMFEALKHRIEEQRHRDEDNADCAAMVSGLDRSFHNMPYLITTSGSPRMTTAPNTACPLHNCDNDDNKNDGLAVVSGDNEHWTYCCA